MKNVFKKGTSSLALAATAMGVGGLAVTVDAGSASASTYVSCSTGNGLCPLTSSTGNFSVYSYASNAVVKANPAGVHSIVLEYQASVKHIQAKVGVSQDGVFGNGTAAAVKRYQAAHGLSADGVVGPATARAMGLNWNTNLSSY